MNFRKWRKGLTILSVLAMALCLSSCHQRSKNEPIKTEKLAALVPGMELSAGNTKKIEMIQGRPFALKVSLFHPEASNPQDVPAIEIKSEGNDWRKLLSIVLRNEKGGEEIIF